MELNMYSKTSARQVPAIFKAIKWRAEDLINLDIGGGRFEDGTKWLQDRGITNLVFDPHCKSYEQNKAIVSILMDKKVDTVTIANVLNVIPDPVERHGIIQMGFTALKEGGRMYISIYEKDRTGVGRMTSAGTFQANRILNSYYGEIEGYLNYSKENMELKGSSFDKFHGLAREAFKMWKKGDMIIVEKLV